MKKVVKKTSASVWKSKIVGHDRVAPDQLLAHPMNWRTHPQSQRDALRAAIEEVGFIRSVTVNKRTGKEWPPNERGVETVVDGHERVWQALTSEQPLIDVEYVDLSPEEEAKALITMDPISEMAKVDGEKLDELMRDVETGSQALATMLTELAEKNKLVPGGTSAQNGEGVQITPSYQVVVEVADEEAQKDLYERMRKEGFKCRLLML